MNIGNKLLNIMAIIFFIFILSTATFAGSSLEDIKIQPKKDQISIVFYFDKLPQFNLKKRNNNLIIYFKNTSTKIINWPTDLKTDLLNSIEASIEANYLVINLSTQDNIEYKIKHNDNRLYLSLYSNTEEKFNSLMSFKLPPAPQKISVPFTKKKYKGAPISIDVQNADIQNILRLLAKIGGFNLVINENVRGKITLSLHNVPWDQVLDIVLSSKGLGMAKIGNVIRIAPLTTLKAETEQLAQIKEALSKEETAAPLETVYLQVNYAKASDLVNQIKTLLSDRGSVTYDDRTNKIVLKDVPSVIEKAKYVISQLDEPVKQVLIEARIVEVTNDFERQLGIQWSGGAWQTTDNTFMGVSPGISSSPSSMETGDTPEITYTMPETTGGPSAIVDLGLGGTGLTSLGFTLGRIAGRSAMLLDVKLNAMERKGWVKVISTPHIVTMDHLPAEIEQGDRIPYIRYTAEGTGYTEFMSTGLILKVTPHITPDNRITLEIEAEKSWPDFSRTVVGVPAIVTRSAKSQVLIDNGETIVIGGIINEDLSESTGIVPGLSNLPIIGKLFKNKAYNKSKQELLIFITARVISTDIKGVDY